MISYNKYVIIIIVIAGLLCGLFIKFFLTKDMWKAAQNQDNKNKGEKLRQPAVAGSFYPGDKDELVKILNEYLDKAELPKYKGVPQIIIVPHAGYIYSGPIAAYGFKTLEGQEFKRAIIIGRSHTAYFNGLAADSNDFWETPLGKVEVDQEFIDLLKKTANIVVVNKDYHKNEHSLEVEVPFLQKVLKEDFKIVPLLFGSDDKEVIEALVDALVKLIDQQTVVIISSDLSHYPSYKDANRLDKEVIDAIITRDVRQFTNKIRELERLQISGVATLACGEVAISSGMMLAERLGLKPYFLKYANSGDFASELKEQVVGYTAIVFVNSEITALSKGEDIKKRELNKQEQKIALEIARKTLEFAFAKHSYKPDVSGYPIFQTKRGVFVTLKKQGQLRGCIGNFEPEQPLVKVIQEMALSAAFNDSRFTPLKADELKECKIEISVLSPREKITDPKAIEVGKHGVYVEKGGASGVYLPQVAVEQGWNREEFLNHLCKYKAGIDPQDCWNGLAELYVFTAQVFKEEE